VVIIATFIVKGIVINIKGKKILTFILFQTLPVPGTQKQMFSTSSKLFFSIKQKTLPFKRLGSEIN